MTRDNNSRDETLRTPAAYEDPIILFNKWMEAAKSTEINDPNAMSLATVDQNGCPNVRIVLLKGISRQGFIFYTNLESAKGNELQSQPKAALCFHWKTLKRQVRIRGEVGLVNNEEADEYYNSRPKESRIGAWASQQSKTMSNPDALKDAVKFYTEKYQTTEIPRPKHWSGFYIYPVEIEFWQDQPYRLHDRILYTRERSQEDEWNKTILFP